MTCIGVNVKRQDVCRVCVNILGQVYVFALYFRPIYCVLIVLLLLPLSYDHAMMYIIWYLLIVMETPAMF